MSEFITVARPYAKIKKASIQFWLNCVPVAKSTKYLEEINHG